MNVLSSALKWLSVPAVLVLAFPALAEEQVILKTRIEKENYAIGIDFVKTLKQRGGEINLDFVIQGMKDELTGKRDLLSEDELRETMLALKKEQKHQPSLPAVKDPGGQTMVASQTDPKKKTGCAVIDYPGHYKAICKGGTEQLTALSPGLSMRKQTSVPVAPEQPVVQEQTFFALRAAQEQAYAEGEPKIELSTLARRHGEYWLKTQQRRQ